MANMATLRTVSWSDGRCSHEVIADRTTAQHLWEILQTQEHVSNLCVYLLGGPQVDPHNGQALVGEAKAKGTEE